MARIRLLVGSTLIAAACFVVPVRSDAKPCGQHHAPVCGGGKCPSGETCYDVNKTCVCKPTKHSPRHARTSATPKGAQPAQ